MYSNCIICKRAQLDFFVSYADKPRTQPGKMDGRKTEVTLNTKRIKVRLGDSFDYVVTATNAEKTTWKNVNVEIRLPEGLVFAGGSGGGSIVAKDNIVDVAFGDIEAGKVEKITITVEVVEPVEVDTKIAIKATVNSSKGKEEIEDPKPPTVTGGSLASRPSSSGTTTDLNAFDEKLLKVAGVVTDAILADGKETRDSLEAAARTITVKIDEAKEATVKEAELTRKQIDEKGDEVIATITGKRPKWVLPGGFVLGIMITWFLGVLAKIAVFTKLPENLKEILPLLNTVCWIAAVIIGFVAFLCFVFLPDWEVDEGEEEKKDK